MLKAKANENAFEILTEKKTKYKKLHNVSYVQLETQSYLLDQRSTFEGKTDILIQNENENVR